jgi:HD-like signal output (HDOD) protein
MYKVDTVERALMILGIDIVEGLVLSHSIFSSISSGPRAATGFNLKDFQTHSLSCGILAKLLIGRISHEEPKNVDRAFTAGYCMTLENWLKKGTSLIVSGKLLTRPVRKNRCY